MSPTGLGYTDPTGRFPYKSSRGAEYIFLAYIYDANAILITTMKDRTAPSIVFAWTKLHNRCKTSGSSPTTYIQDNEISKSMQDVFTSEEITYKLVPPHFH